MALIDHNKIVVLRKQRGLDQIELAQLAKIDQSVISRLERGLQDDFKLSVVASVASALGVTVDSLLVRNSISNSILEPELESVLSQVTKLPAKIQRHAAVILQAYLSTLE